MSDEIDYKAEVLKIEPAAMLRFGGVWGIEKYHRFNQPARNYLMGKSWQDAYEKHCKPAPVSKEVSAEAVCALCGRTKDKHP